MPISILENPGMGSAIANTVVDFASTANVNIATQLTNGTAFGGGILATGQTILLKDQTVESQNGAYIVPATGAASRNASLAIGSDSFGKTIDVRAGSSAGVSYKQISSPGVVGTNSLRFEPQAIASLNSFLFADLAVDQPIANISFVSGAHFPFDRTVVSRGSDITLDTTTTYTVANNVASKGRFLLKAGKEYKLTGRVMLIGSNASTYAGYSWFNADTGVALAQSVEGGFSSPLSTDLNVNNADAIAYFTPSVNTRVEIRLTGVAGAISNWYGGNNNIPGSYATIEVVSQSAPSKGQISNNGLWVTKGSTAAIGATAGSNINFGSDLINEGSSGINFNGINWTLTAGTYLLEADLQDGANTVFPLYEFWNNTTNTPLGSRGQSRGTSTSFGGEVAAKARIVVTSPISISLRAQNAFTIAANNSNVNSFVQILQVGSNTINGFPLIVNNSNSFTEGLYHIATVKLSGNTFEFFEDLYLRLEMQGWILRWTSVNTVKNIGVYGFNSGSTASSLPVTTDSAFIGVGGYSSTPVGTFQAIANVAIGADYDDIQLFWIQMAQAPVKYRITIMGGSLLCAIVERWDLTNIPVNTKITIN